ncbi:Adenylate cyclase, class 3 [Paenibacillus sp. 1_12]|uniref:adenylate/guanylate cyclase domain-containing protein n=1 Tax=Paenibacillus sp. 1_12 TaxID=1566278 RepID=UPI0008E44F0A|nr:adenylate/guanylate cyclase domain-containing protein [Paenibacillus sp. 1_12]SFK71582.1 Adenylate cyclase, class 3 [Paenibacillus sp. 1_12]
MPLPAQKHVYEQEYALSRDKVWELLSNTDHLNRVIGLFPIRSTSFHFQNTNFFQELSAKVVGVVPMRWKEHPFQWVKNVRYDVVREYRGGPLKRFWGGIELEDTDTILSDGSRATKVKLFAEFTPANALGLVAIPIVGVSSMRKTLKYLQTYLQLKEQEKEHLLPQTEISYKVNTDELHRLLEELQRVSGDVKMTERLREHLMVSGDDQVIDMRPYELAKIWDMDREVLLRMFLYATKLGITNLSWHLICPNCRVSKSGAETMSGLKPQYHCDFCGINYEVNFDKYVELCFSVHPHLRRAYKQIFCVGGPAITPHIYVQLEIAAGNEAEFEYPKVPEQLRLRVLRSNQTVSIVRQQAGLQSRIQNSTLLESQANDMKSQASLAIRQAAAARIEDGHIHSGQLDIQYDGHGWSIPVVEEPLPGTLIKLVNHSRENVIVALEKDDWEDITVTASKVTTMHEFRSMFSSEVLAPGQQVGIENVTILFSDLLGSTAFYEQVGDAHAYGQVRNHFNFLISWVNANKGTLVKTIGDAVMAVFEYPENAVKTALDVQSHVDEFNRKYPSNTPIVIKMGLFQGPAIVVNSNQLLDYFGRTVNLAARMQGLSVGHDVVISKECSERPGVQALLASYEVQIEQFEQRLKGIDEVIQLTRVQIIAGNTLAV